MISFNRVRPINLFFNSCVTVYIYLLLDDELERDELERDELERDDDLDDEPKLDLEDLDGLADDLFADFDEDPKELDRGLDVELFAGLVVLLLLNPDVTGLELVVALNDLCDVVGAAIDFTLADTTGEDFVAFGDTILLAVLVVVLVIVELDL
jgi:hypothetical protein